MALLNALALKGSPGEEHDQQDSGKQQESQPETGVDHTEGNDDGGECAEGLDADDVSEDGDDRGCKGELYEDAS